jgi:hypothetical protein
MMPAQLSTASQTTRQFQPSGQTTVALLIGPRIVHSSPVQPPLHASGQGPASTTPVSTGVDVSVTSLSATLPSATLESGVVPSGEVAESSVPPSMGRLESTGTVESREASSGA